MEQRAEPELDNFFDIVNRLGDIYVSYRGRYVVMVPQEGKIFMPKTSAGPARLTNRVLAQHLNRRIAVSVFAGAYSSKFICFDVDLPEPAEVRRLMNVIAGRGIPRDLIYVSTSGGKGYHVEVFFDGLVYTEQLHKFYDCVCAEGGFDPRKVEFRPTHGQSIKLPLSMHYKTGRVCWYLDRDTLLPIEDPAYVLQIRQMKVADFEAVVERLPKVIPQLGGADDDIEPAAKKMAAAELERLEGDGYPDLLEPGHRHNTMLSIGIHNRYRGLSQERNRAELLAWAARQPEDFLLQPPELLEREADDIVRWVYSEQFVAAAKAPIIEPVTFTADDIAYWAAQPNRTCRKFIFLLRWKLKRHTVCAMSYDWVGQTLGVSWKTAFDAVWKLVQRRQIDLVHGRPYMDNGQLKRKPNKYYLAGATPPPLDGWSCKGRIILPEHLAEPTPDNFMEVYSTVLQAMVPQERLKTIMGKKERGELDVA